MDFKPYMSGHARSNSSVEGRLSAFQEPFKLVDTPLQPTEVLTDRHTQCTYVQTRLPSLNIYHYSKKGLPPMSAHANMPISTRYVWTMRYLQRTGLSPRDASVSKAPAFEDRGAQQRRPRRNETNAKLKLRSAP